MAERPIPAAAAAIALRHERRRRRLLRVVGSVLIAYGLVGVLLLAVVGQAISAPLDEVVRLGDSVEEQRAAALEALEQASATLEQAAGGVRNMDLSLSQGRAATERSSVLSRGVAANMYQLAEAMTLTVFGIQPLIGLAQGFQQSGEQLELLSEDLAAIGDALNANREDAVTIARSLDELAAAVRRLTVEVRGGPRIEVAGESLEALRLGTLAMLIWLGALAVGAILAGAFCWWAARGDRVATSA